MKRAVLVLIALAVPALSAAQQPCTPDARRVVNQLYRNILERTADWRSDDFVRRLASGEATVQDIVRNIVMSDEYRRQFIDAADTDAAHRKTVTYLYRHLLGRAPDEGGLQAHVTSLQSQSIGEVIDGILASSEYREKFGAQGVPGSDFRYCGAAYDTSTRRADPWANPAPPDDRSYPAARESSLASLDANRDGRITGDEWRGSIRLFSDLDTDRNGVLTRDEWRDTGVDGAVGTTGTTRSSTDRFGTPTNSVARFTDLDRNRNGRLERNEWTGAAADFDRADWDRNNLLSRDEAIAAFDALADDFDALDRDHDGRLTIREWNWNRRSFDQQDVNRDGVITAREFTGRPRSDY